ncbi:phospholipase C, phosphocholine-specific [Burkholderia cepacia JBK9]|uniref:phosphocholine-specific phospholipase C n=1 Tax=Burkholderia arboris TaxID=488730 RepID=UPI0007409BDB|nr:phospholipase C, phosphocholine-specific [Burkholderia arboris]ALX16628.1 phospholipase C, phosphocholine-specific [Burkholderia cepacia JBK9]MCA8489529.1 phospholipase C, phosphocholine-specific [Burkholderia arboris]UTV60491.1 phospholipase C, phosphocholine-specific [Burkholderia arboris]
MTSIDRRSFLRAAAAGTAFSMFPPAIRRALAIPANNQTGTINDVQHVVIFMQENRSFDHYFGTMPGVRGFGDRLTIPQPGAASVWQQNDGKRPVLPFYLDSTKGNALLVGGAHSWTDSHSAWDNGRMTAWPASKGDASMGYLRQSDLPFHFALANAFTVCDAYHCSLHGGTNSNRIFLWTGTNGPTGSNTAVVNNDGWDGLGSSKTGLTWTTYPERLQASGVSWKVYQNMPDNYTDNPLAGFATFRKVNETVPGSPNAPYTPAMEALSPLYKGIGNTMPDGGFLQSLADDIAANRMPQVSWIVSPTAYCEHPGASTPGQGAYYLQRLLDTLTANPDVWSKTVLFVNYDENDGFFDHMPPPNPPSRNPDGTYAGKSTVTTQYEYFTLPNPPGDSSPLAPDGRPYGPGPRVPMFVVSPWSTGGWVNSEVFDHTSVLRFLEQRFGVQEPNISPWRRAVCGDMTSAFNFKNPNGNPTTSLPAPTKAAADAQHVQQALMGAVPVPSVALQQMPVQPQGTRPSRALPYELHTSASADVSGGLLWLTFSNTGTVGAVFHVYDKLHLDRAPRRFTVEAGKQLSDAWRVVADDAGNYDLWVLGPNGFLREFQGNVAKAASGPVPEIRVCYDPANDAVYLTIMNVGNAASQVTVTSNAYRTDGPWRYAVPAGMQVEPYWTLAASSGWYDFTLAAENGLVRRFAGRVETGRDSISDPAMGVSS